MTSSEFEALKTDYLEWTGGYEPESEDDIATYVDTSMPFALNSDDAVEALQAWMRDISVG